MGRLMISMLLIAIIGCQVYAKVHEKKQVFLESQIKIRSNQQDKHVGLYLDEQTYEWREYNPAEYTPEQSIRYYWDFGGQRWVYVDPSQKKAWCTDDSYNNYWECTSDFYTVAYVPSYYWDDAYGWVEFDLSQQQPPRGVDLYFWSEKWQLYIQWDSAQRQATCYHPDYTNDCTEYAIYEFSDILGGHDQHYQGQGYDNHSQGGQREIQFFDSVTGSWQVTTERPPQNVDISYYDEGRQAWVYYSWQYDNAWCSYDNGNSWDCTWEIKNEFQDYFSHNSYYQQEQKDEIYFLNPETQSWEIAQGEIPQRVDIYARDNEINAWVYYVFEQDYAECYPDDYSPSWDCTQYVHQKYRDYFERQ